MTSRIEKARSDARLAGLVYTTDRSPGISRRRCGPGWAFFDPDGGLVRDRGVRERCLSLAIPPAYEKVWICPDPRGHLQATGRDRKGRKTYVYHADWRAFRNEKKFDALLPFGEALPAARKMNDARRHGTNPGQGRILAAIFWLLDQHALRIGNTAYAEENESYGATTLRQRHIDENAYVLNFAGKSGREQKVHLGDRRIKNLVRSLSDLPGQYLFQYKDEGGHLHPITSSEVNAYLKGLFEGSVTAKTFRTWHGSLEAFSRGLTEGALVDEVLEAAASRLGNTKAICRNSYVHPRIVEEVKSGALAKSAKTLKGGRPREGLSPEESWFIRWLART